MSVSAAACASPSSSTFRLPLAQAPNGRLIAVAEAERGGGGGLVCPDCGAPVVARKGQKVRHYFAHKGDMACVGAAETMLHRFAKQVIADAGTVWFPAGQLDPREPRVPVPGGARRKRP